MGAEGGWRKEATKAEPHWTPATLRGDVALSPAIVQARKMGGAEGINTEG